MRRGRLIRLALPAALGAAALFAADSFVFVPVPKAVVEERVQAYSKKPLERRDGLRRLFEAAGCVSPNLTEQAVKHERLGNVICTLPGLTDSKIGSSLFGVGRPDRSVDAAGAPRHAAS